MNILGNVDFDLPGNVQAYYGQIPTAVTTLGGRRLDHPEDLNLQDVDQRLRDLAEDLGLGVPNLAGGAGTRDLRGSPVGDLLGNAISHGGALAQTTSGSTVVIDSAGRAADFVSVVRLLTNTIASGGRPSSHEITLLNRLTPAQRHAAGIFLNSAGQVIPPQRVLTAAINNLQSGTPLTPNQNVLFGQLYRNLNTDQRRTLVAELGRPSGTSASASRALLAPALNTAVRAAIDVNQTARADAERLARVATRDARTTARADLRDARSQILDVVGRDTTFRTRSGRTVTAREVVHNALLNRQAGRPLTANQQAVLRTYRASTGQRVEVQQQSQDAALRERQEDRRQALIQRQQVRAAAVPAAERSGLSERQQVQLQQQATRQRQAVRQQDQRQALERRIEAAVPGAERRDLLQQRQTLERQQQLNRQAVAERQAVHRAEARQASQPPAALARAQQVQVARQEAAARAQREAQQAAARTQAARQARQTTFTTAGGAERTRREVLAAAQERQAVGQALRPIQREALAQQQVVQRAREAQTRAQAAAQEATTRAAQARQRATALAQAPTVPQQRQATVQQATQQRQRERQQEQRQQVTRLIRAAEPGAERRALRQQREALVRQQQANRATLAARQAAHRRV